MALDAGIRDRVAHGFGVNHPRHPGTRERLGFA
jgi:hypothetical protein